MPNEDIGSLAFGYRTGWIAVACEDPAAIVSGFASARSTPWAQGLATAQSVVANEPSPLLVSAAVDGWVFLVGSQIALGAGPAIDVLSQHFLDVQRFTSHRVADAYSWARSRSGRTVRHYSFADGMVATNEGTPDAAELALGLTYDQPTTDEDYDSAVFPDEDTVLAVAAAWSIDPTTLDERNVLADTAWLVH